MTKPFKLAFIVAALAAAGLVSSCVGFSSKGMKDSSYGPPDAAKAVLVSSDQSDYKKAVIAEIARDLSERGIRVEVTSLDSFASRASGRWHLWRSAADGESPSIGAAISSG